jgi:hypothetical protein
VKPEDERNLVQILIIASMTGATLVKGWQLRERSFGKGTFRVHFERPVLGGGDPHPVNSIRARYRWNGTEPSKLSYTATYRVV